MGLILNGYEVMGYFLIVVKTLLWTARCKSHYVTLKQMEEEQSAEAVTHNSQLATFRTEQQGELRQSVAFPKTCLTL